MHSVAETFKPFDFPIIRIDLKPSAVTDYIMEFYNVKKYIHSMYSSNRIRNTQNEHLIIVSQTLIGL